MKILDRFPFDRREEAILSPGGVVAIKPYQIAIRVSLTRFNDTELDPGTPQLPAIIDTGNSYTFAIREEQLIQVGLPYRSKMGTIRIGDQILPLIAANVWIHRNQVGSRADRGDAYLLELSGGIAMYPSGMPDPARLAILGLRAIAQNNLKLWVDGKRRHATLKTAGWF